MALYIPHSIFHLARLLYVRPETFGPYDIQCWLWSLFVTECVYCMVGIEALIKLSLILLFKEAFVSKI